MVVECRGVVIGGGGGRGLVLASPPPKKDTDIKKGPLFTKATLYEKGSISSSSSRLNR